MLLNPPASKPQRAPCFRHVLFCFATIAFGLHLSGSSRAVTYTWTGTGPTDGWSDAGNWTSVLAPPTSPTSFGVEWKFVFTGSRTTAEIDNDFEVTDIRFDSGVAGMTFNGNNTLTLIPDSSSSNPEGFFNNDNSTQRFANDEVIFKFSNNDYSIAATSGILEFDAKISVDGGVTLAVSGDNNVRFDGGLVATGGGSGPITVNKTGAGQLRFRDNATGIDQLNIFGGEVFLSGVNSPSLDAGLNVNVTSGTFDINDQNTNIDQLTGFGSVDLGSGTLTFGDTVDFTFAGVIFGTGGVTHNQNGTTTLEGVNTYSGATNITSGTIRLASGGSLSSASDLSVSSGAAFDLNGVNDTLDSISGAGTIQLGNATLTVDESSGTRTFSGNIIESGELQKNGGGTLVLSGSNTFSLLDINSGVVRASSQANLGAGTIELSSGTLQLTSSFTNARSINANSASGVINVDSGVTLTQSGAISGTGTINKQGNGVLVYNASNSYTGDTTINDGTLRLNVSNAIGNSSDVELVVGATLDMNNRTDTVRSLSGPGGTVDTGGSSGRLTVNASSGTFTYSGAMFGTGGFTKSGNHTLVVTNPFTYTGSTNINDGVLRFSGNGDFSSASDIAIAAGATWDLSGLNDLVDSISGGGDILLGGATLTVDENNNTRTFSGDISEIGNFVKSGSSRLTFSGNNTYTGTTTLDQGVLEVSSSANLGAGTLVFDSGSLNVAGSFTNSRTIAINPGDSANLDVDGGVTLTQTGVVDGDAGTLLQKLGAGTMELFSASGGTFTGDITVFEGSLVLGSGDTLNPATTIDVRSIGSLTVTQTEGWGGLTGAGDVNIQGSQLVEVGLHNADATFSGVISGTGRFAKGGTAVQTLSGNNTSTGTTTVSAGTLRLSGSGRLSDATDVDVDLGATFDLNDVSDAIDALTGSGSVTLGTGSANTLTVGASGGSGTFLGVISEGGKFVKTGGGTQTLTGNNAWNAGTEINGGTLRIASSSNLGSGGISIDNATLEITGTTTNPRGITLQSGGGTIEVSPGQTFTMSPGTPISGVGDLTLFDNGRVILNAVNTYDGDTDILGTELIGGVFAALPDTTNVTIDAGSWELNNDDTVRSISGNGEILLVGGNLTVTQDSGARTYSGVISDAGGIVKQGTHTLLLSGFNTYEGDTVINDGTLQITQAANLGEAVNDIVFGGGTLYLLPAAPVVFNSSRNLALNEDGNIYLEAGSELTIPGVISGAGALNVVSDNEETLTLTGVNTYLGGTTLTEAFLDISQNANLGANSGSVTMTDGLLATDDTFTNLHEVVLDGRGAFEVLGATLTQAAPITGVGDLGISGTGTLRLTEPATHAGDTTISGTATLQFGSGELPDAFDVTVRDATSTWDLNGVDDAIDELFGAGTVLLGGATLTIGAGDGDSGDFSNGSIIGPGGLTKVGSGTHVLGDGNTHTIATRISEGALEIQSDSSLGAPSAELIFDDGVLITTTTFSTGRTTTINSSGEFNVGGGSTLTFASPIGGAGELIKSGAGTLELTQANSYLGVTDINAGTLLVSGAGLLPDTTDVQIDGSATFDMTDLVDAVDGLSGAGTVELGTGTLTIGASDGGGLFSGIITGVGNGGTIIKEGAGTAIFSGSNTYAGGTEINGGVLEISQDENLGAPGGQVAFDGGTLRTAADITTVREMSVAAGDGTIEVEAGTTLEAGGNIAGVGMLNKTGDGTLVLSGISSYAGTNILGGVLSASFNFNLGTANGPLLIDGATLQTTNIFTTSRATTIGPGGATLDVLTGTTHTHNGVIGGNAGNNPLVKSGDGLLRFTGANTFVAPLLLEAGTLEVDATGQLGNIGNTIGFDGGTLSLLGTFASPRTMELNLGGGTLDVAGGVTFTQTGLIQDGPSGPAGALNKSGSGLLRFSADNVYTGPTNIQQGTLRLIGGGRLPDVTDVDVASGATWNLNNISDAIDALSGSGDVVLGTGTLTVGSDDGSGTFAGTISGAGGVVKVGAGTQSLQTKIVGEDEFPNTYAGGTAINGGTLDIQGDDNLGDPTGGLSFDNGTLQLAGDSSLTTERSVTLNAGGGTVNLAGEDASATFAGVISGPGSITKIGQGTLSYDADHTYAGETIIASGIFRLMPSGQVPDASTVTVNAGGLMGGWDLNDVDDAIDGLNGFGRIDLGTATLTVGAAGGNGNFSGLIEGDGSVAKAGAGTQILTGNNTYLGGTSLLGGTLQVNGNNNLGDPAGSLTFDGATLAVQNTATIGRAATLQSGGGTLSMPAPATLTYSGQISGAGGLEKEGQGTLILSAVNSYDGATDIQDGLLQLAAAERLPNTTTVSVAAPAQFSLNNNNETIDGLSGAGVVDLGAAQLTVGISGGDGNFTGVITGAGDFQKEGGGTQSLAGGQHTFTGATVVNGGTLVASSGTTIDQTSFSVGFNNGSDGAAIVTDAATAWTVGGNLTVGGQGLGRLEINDGAVVDVGGDVLLGTGLGEGTLLVDGGTLDNSAGTRILVQDGTLGGRGDILGDVINQDILAPGTSAGVLDLTGTYVQEVTGTFAAEIGGTGAGQFDVLNVSSTASLAGDLELSLLGFAPAPSDAFAILVAGTLVGEFDNVADGARLNILSGGTGSFEVNYTPTSVLLSDFQGTADNLPGDFNNDDQVGGADFLAWQRGNSPNPFSSADLGAWQSNYGASVPGVASGRETPEPTAAALFLLAAATMGLHSCRRRHSRLAVS